LPEEISLPLASLEEVDQFEGWLKNPGNTVKKQHLVFVLIKHLSPLTLGIHTFFVVVKEHLNKIWESAW